MAPQRWQGFFWSPREGGKGSKGRMSTTRYSQNPLEILSGRHTVSVATLPFTGSSDTHLIAQDHVGDGLIIGFLNINLELLEPDYSGSCKVILQILREGGRC